MNVLKYTAGRQDKTGNNDKWERGKRKGGREEDVSQTKKKRKKRKIEKSIPKTKNRRVLSRTVSLSLSLLRDNHCGGGSSSRRVSWRRIKESAISTSSTCGAVHLDAEGRIDLTFAKTKNFDTF